MLEVKSKLARFAVIVPKENAQFTRKVLEDGQVWDKSRRLRSLSGGKVAIPVLNAELAQKVLLTENSGTLSNCWYEKAIEITALDLPPSKKSLMKTPYESLVERLVELVQGSELHGPWDDLHSTIPRHWEIHGDLVLLPPTAFVSDFWKTFGEDLWPVVAESLGCKRLGRKHNISMNGFRTPQVELLLGKDGWVNHTDNGIKYSYDVTRCMFSSGNVTEKLRVASFDCTGQTVVDLYAGIGYFSLPYLVHAGAERVHACEWNPDAVEALRRNLCQNGVEGRCVIHAGDNRQVCPQGVADRVNLGLIPSSEGGWPVACAALKPTGGTLHIHSNVTAIVSSSGHAGGKPSQCSTVDEKAPNDVKFTSGGETDKIHGAANNSSAYEDVGKLGTPGLGCSNLSCDNPSHDHDDSHSENFPRNSSSDIDIKKSDTDDCRSCFKDNAFDQIDQNNSDNHHDQTDYESVNEYRNCDGPAETLTISAAKMHLWLQWAEKTRCHIERLLFSFHKKKWRTEVLHIEHVKSYAPHIDHIVLDLLCKPA